MLPEEKARIGIDKLLGLAGWTVQDLKDFITCYNSASILERKESDRFHAFTYDQLMQRDKVNIDIFWLRDDSLEDTDNLPDPDIIVLEIAENLEDALAQFSGISSTLGTKNE